MLAFVCTTADVPVSECREFAVLGRCIIVCEYQGAYFAHSAMCSHLAYSLDWAPVRDGLIECPWHRFCYDVVTGTNVTPGKICPTGDPALSKPVAPLQTFALELRGDAIYVAM